MRREAARHRESQARRIGPVSWATHSGRATSALVARCLLLAVAIAVMGVGATAVAYWSAERYPLERGRRLPHLLVHAALSLVVVTAQALAFSMLRGHALLPSG
jgi:hypothetical protein